MTTQVSKHLTKGVRKVTTVAEIATGSFGVGSHLSLEDRGDAPFNVEATGAYVVNNLDILPAGVGRVARLVFDDIIYTKHLGLVGDYTTGIDDTPVFARAMELANPTTEITHSISESRTIQFYGKPLVNGSIVIREGVTLMGEG